jgi:hypothetical protein
MKRKSLKPRIATKSLTISAPEIGMPTLGQAHRLEATQVHHLVAVGIRTASPTIGGKPDDAPQIAGKKRRNSPRREVLLTQLQRLREQGHDVEKMENKQIAYLLGRIWPKDLPFPLRARGHRKN